LLFFKSDYLTHEDFLNVRFLVFPRATVCPGASFPQSYG